jgi:hypothetical protein
VAVSGFRSASFFAAIQAQELQAVALEGTPSVFFDSDGKVNACGLRFFGVEVIATQGLFRSVDISLTVPLEAAKKGFGLVKAYGVVGQACELAGY